MLQFINRTPFRGTVYLMPDPDGIESVFTVLKGTFVLGERPEPAGDQVPVTLADEYYADQGTSSIKMPADVALMKPGTDVLLVGSAVAPGGRAAAQLDVSLSVGPVRKMVRVLGDRVWTRGATGASISRPASFETMPLVWERAFGGTDHSGGELRAEPRNPVGTGFRAPDSAPPPDGLRLPNLEDPASPVTSRKDTPPPACFAAVSPHWEPRRSYAGTYDDEWQRRRAPYLPRDFDPRFLQLAPPGLVAIPHLQGGEPAELRGVTASGVLRFTLPQLGVEVTHVMDRARHARPALLDTVLIEPDAARLILVWRAALPCPKEALRVREVHVDMRAAA